MHAATVHRSKPNLSVRLSLPTELAVTFWRSRGVWSREDEQTLRLLVEERTFPDYLPFPSGGSDEAKQQWRRDLPWRDSDRITSAYVLIPRQELHDFGIGSRKSGLLRPFGPAERAAVVEHLAQGRFTTPYVAFTGERPWRYREKSYVNLITAAPGYMDVRSVINPADAGWRQRTQIVRIATQSSRVSSARSRQAIQHVCATCFLEVPASGVCDSCDT